MNTLNVITKQVTIDTPADVVWRAIADLGSIDQYHPGVSESHYTTDQREGEGACRHCTLKPMGSVEERVVGWDEGKSITIDIYQSKGMPPMSDFQGTWSLSPQGDNKTELSFTMQYRMKLGMVGALMNGMMMHSQFDKMASLVVRGFKRGIEKEKVVQ